MAWYAHIKYNEKGGGGLQTHLASIATKTLLAKKAQDKAWAESCKLATASTSLSTALVMKFKKKLQGRGGRPKKYKKWKWKSGVKFSLPLWTKTLIPSHYVRTKWYAWRCGFIRSIGGFECSQSRGQVCSLQGIAPAARYVHFRVVYMDARHKILLVCKLDI